MFCLCHKYLHGISLELHLTGRNSIKQCERRMWLVTLVPRILRPSVAFQTSQTAGRRWFLLLPENIFEFVRSPTNQPSQWIIWSPVEPLIPTNKRISLDKLWHPNQCFILFEPTEYFLCTFCTRSISYCDENSFEFIDTCRKDGIGIRVQLENGTLRPCYPKMLVKWAVSYLLYDLIGNGSKRFCKLKS